MASPWFFAAVAARADVAPPPTCPEGEHSEYRYRYRCVRDGYHLEDEDGRAVEAQNLVVDVQADPSSGLAPADLDAPRAALTACLREIPPDHRALGAVPPVRVALSPGGARWDGPPPDGVGTPSFWRCAESRLRSWRPGTAVEVVALTIAVAPRAVATPAVAPAPEPIPPVPTAAPPRGGCANAPSGLPSLAVLGALAALAWPRRRTRPGA